MTKETRRFAVDGKDGTRYTVVERCDFATINGHEVQVGSAAFATSTGWTVAQTAPGEYRIERLGVVVRDRRS